MKKFLSTSVAAFMILIVSAQVKVDYQLCGLDFRPLPLRSGLPAGAVYTDVNASAYARAWDVVNRLTFDEKLNLTGGWNSMYFPGIPRLGLSPIYFSDASQGIRIQNLCVKVGKTTSFPCELALAATWDPELAYDYAKSIGEECQAWGINVLLGPGINMYRNSEGGRNFEYMGEDPFLTSTMAAQYVNGIQSTGTIATLKHFIGNEQEFARTIVDVKIGERALHEIYLPPFEESIKKSCALAVMTGNNMVNGYPGAANKLLSGDVLRKEYDFKGIIMSDWANSKFWKDNLDLELPSGQSLLMADNKIFADYIRTQSNLHPEKKVAIEKELGQMVFHNLFSFFKSGVYDRPYRNPELENKIDDHEKIALKTAEEAITLLKNENNVLPVNPDKVNKIVVIGTKEALHVYTGGGSGKVEGYNQVDYLTGLKKVYGNKIFHDSITSDDDVRSADVVIYFINKKASEGTDIDFNLPDVSKNINKYSSLNKNLVVVFSGGNGFAMPWINKVKGLIFAYLLGQKSGIAMANVISGKVNPSGKLPFTIEKEFKDSPAYDYNKMSDGNYYWGGSKIASGRIRERFGNIDITYREGIYIGYRWYENKKIQPLYSFGFGLSYTTFSFSDIKVSSKSVTKQQPVTISFSVKNTGIVPGAEIAQLYLHEINGPTIRPVKFLKGFKRVFLNPGETKEINLLVNAQDLAYWSEKDHDWVINIGQYMINVGPSSQDIRQRTVISY